MKKLITDLKIQSRIKELAQAIDDDHTKSTNTLPPVFICVLNGAYMFFSDLTKSIKILHEVDFIRAKSYIGQDNSGGVEITKDIELSLKGKRVYIIEDMIDSGNTMLEILIRVHDKQPAEVKVVTLLHRRTSTFPVDFYAFDIDTEWTFGYGLDDGGIRRNYTDIWCK
jgi:hypoxanthine phosphoribosyltransferase